MDFLNWHGTPPAAAPLEVVVDDAASSEVFVDAAAPLVLVEEAAVYPVAVEEAAAPPVAAKEVPTSPEVPVYAAAFPEKAMNVAVPLAAISTPSPREHRKEGFLYSIKSVSS